MTAGPGYCLPLASRQPPPSSLPSSLPPLQPINYQPSPSPTHQPPPPSSPTRPRKTRGSALRDSRFAPIALREVPRLSCGISLLRCFEEGREWHDWTVGVHGIVLSFVDPEARRQRSATYLPEVAREQGWNQREAVDSLMRKAGYGGPLSDALRASASVTRYQSSKAALDFEAYDGPLRAALR